MNTIQGLSIGAIGGFVGAALLAMIGFGWGGWMTTGDANDYAKQLAKTEVIASMVPICVAQARLDPNSKDVIAYINDANGYIRMKMLMQTGWATMPGAKLPNNSVARACVAELIGTL